VCVYVACVFVCVCLCVGVKERWRVIESDRESTRERLCACGREKERDGVRESDRESA